MSVGFLVTQLSCSNSKKISDFVGYHGQGNFPVPGYTMSKLDNIIL